MSNNEKLTENWRKFVNHWQTLAQESGFPEIEADSDWPSPCETLIEDKLCWRPVEQADFATGSRLSFENVEHALGLTLNEQYKLFFTQYFADGFSASHAKGDLQYLQAWSEQDFERLQQNLIGHLMMKSKLKQPATLFFAVTDEDDLNLVVENESGKVALEYVGKEPHQILADSLADFIADTTPVL